jgi:probable rRNA maturation factor
MQNKIFRFVSLKVDLADKKIIECIQNHLKLRKKEGSVLEVDIVGKARMRTLNKKFMSHDYATDVLSFPVADFPRPSNYDFIGTVVLCNDIIHKQAKKLDKTFEDEFLFYLRHGIDHLIGIHHK